MMFVSTELSMMLRKDLFKIGSQKGRAMDGKVLTPQTTKLKQVNFQGIWEMLN